MRRASIEISGLVKLLCYIYSEGIENNSKSKKEANQRSVTESVEGEGFRGFFGM